MVNGKKIISALHYCERFQSWINNQAKCTTVPRPMTLRAPKAPVHCVAVS